MNPGGSMPLFIWPQFPQLCAGTTVRTDGNFGAGKLVDETGKAAAEENRKKLAASLGFSTLHTFRQTHSAIIRPACGDSTEEADALSTAHKGELLGIHTADCIPVFFYAPKEGAIALAHSGRMGLCAGISEEVLSSLNRSYGASPRDIYVHIGPHISASVYEVGAEIFAQFGLPCPAAKGFLDMQGILLKRLKSAGVDEKHISASNLCTLSAKDSMGRPLFFSYRGGDTGQILSFIGLRPY